MSNTADGLWSNGVLPGPALGSDTQIKLALFKIPNFRESWISCIQCLRHAMMYNRRNSSFFLRFNR